MIPVCEPLVKEKEKELVLDCLNSGWISSAGKYLAQFENAWSAYCGMRHGIAVTSGTAALQIAIGLLDLHPGDEVIMPTFTIISCAQAITAHGGVPVLVDSDTINWQMDVSCIEEKITERTRAIMPVHIYGHPVDMDPVLAIARRYNLTVIEDAAEAHGAQYKGHMCGSMGDVSVFSFYANKIITTGEGGMILTQSDKLAEKARALRNLCFQPSRRFYHENIGYNFRMTNIQAAIGTAQLERIDQIIDTKRAIAKAYSERLGNVSGLCLPAEAPWARSVYWVYGIVLEKDTGLNALQLADYMLDAGIETRPFFLGIHQQPVFQNMGLFVGEHYPVAENLSSQGLYLPAGLSISMNEIDRICKTIQAFLGGWKGKIC